MVISYDGTAIGFQTQPMGIPFRTLLNMDLTCLLVRVISITASGRTDAGVHARGQVFNFNTLSPIPIERWCLALNSRLPKDIVDIESR